MKKFFFHLPFLLWAFIPAGNPVDAGMLTLAELDGSDGDQETLLTIMNRYSNGAWTFGSNFGDNFLEYTPSAGSQTVFEKELINAWAVESWLGEGFFFPHFKYTIGRSLPGVFVGAFTPGAQLIDLDDVLQFPVEALYVHTQASVLFHELFEGMFNALGLSYSRAHEEAIIRTNDVLLDFGGKATQLTSPSSKIPLPGGKLLVRMPFVTTGGNQISTDILLATSSTGTAIPSFDVSDIRRGLLHINKPYSGRDLDITVESVTSNEPPVSTPVPEPSSFALLGIGAMSLAGYGHRRRKRSSRADASD